MAIVCIVLGGTSGVSLTNNSLRGNSHWDFSWYNFLLMIAAYDFLKINYVLVSS